MRLLITGGAGFIGSHLADALIDQGCHVIAVDNLSLGREANLAHLHGHPRFRFQRLELLVDAELHRLFAAESFDAVFHLAANSDIARSHHDPDVDRDNSFATTYAVLRAMKEHGTQQIVFASTSAIYGELRGPLSEGSGPLVPVSHYGAAKLASEAFISSFAANYDFRAWIVRFPNVVGGRATHGAIHDFIAKLRRNPDVLEVLGDGRQIKPYLHVRDLVAAILLIWDKAGERINVFNVGVESRTSVKRIAEMVIEEMGLPASIRYSGGSRGWIGDVPEFHYRMDRVHALGWRARASSDEAVRLAIREILESHNEDPHSRRRQGDAPGLDGCAQTDGAHRRTDAA
ncbi:MAG TPA: NAD-dependent epimerase/dehydratase family protein [Gemmataceae bacterium]|nr:NAD-dependent epimerase/dehydratase family protein [Gemmataceae bacterium]